MICIPQTETYPMFLGCGVGKYSPVDFSVVLLQFNDFMDISPHILRYLSLQVISHHEQHLAL